MKRAFHIISTAFLLWTGANLLHAQASPSATRRGSVQVGAGWTLAHPDYTNQMIQGISVYGDYNFSRHLGIEGDVHLATIFTPRDIGLQSYLVGPRYVFHIKRFQPYGKFLGGIGRFKTDYDIAPNSTFNYGIYAFGGGVDVPLTPHLNIRAVDFEYQKWPGFEPNGLSPLVWTFGAAYRFR